MNDITKPTRREHSHNTLKFLVKSLAGIVPGGSVVSEFFDLVVKDPAIQRRDHFMMALADRLDELAENSQFDPATILGNDDVSAFLMQSIQISVRSSGKRKLEALREAAVRGTIAPTNEQRAPGYVVLGIIDRLTDYHIILLRWKSKPRPMYTYGQVKGGAFDGLFYGLPTFGDPKELREPHCVFSHDGVQRYVEADDKRNFDLVKRDLISLGLLEPILVQEEYREGREIKRRLTPEIGGYKISDFGMFIVSYIEAAVLDGEQQSVTPPKES